MTFKMLRKGALVALLLLVSVSGFGQKFLWDVNFKSGFDNREYKNLETAQSATLFGLQFEPAVGLGWGEGHSIFAGGYLMAHYGARNPRYTVLRRFSINMMVSILGQMPVFSQRERQRGIILRFSWETTGIMVFLFKGRCLQERVKLGWLRLFLTGLAG